MKKVISSTAEHHQRYTLCITYLESSLQTIANQCYFHFYLALQFIGKRTIKILHDTGDQTDQVFLDSQCKDRMMYYLQWMRGTILGPDGGLFRSCFNCRLQLKTPWLLRPEVNLQSLTIKGQYHQTTDICPYNYPNSTCSFCVYKESQTLLVQLFWLCLVFGNIEFHLGFVCTVWLIYHQQTLANGF